jgi:rRNA maturation endonuclease Nob1
MKKLKPNEIECVECTNVFKVKTASKDPVCFCPFCGEEVIVEIDEDEIDEEDLEDVEEDI